MNGKLLPSVLLLACFMVFAASGPSRADPCGDGLEACLRAGEDLYRTHHLAPGRYEEAIRLYEQGLSMKPDDYGILWKLSEMYMNYGEILDPGDGKERKISSWTRGAEYGARAVKVKPDGREGHFYYMANIGARARLQGTWTSLRAFFRIKKAMDRTLELDPDYPPALVARAQFLTEMPAIFGRDEQEAVRLYTRALEQDPGFVVALYYLARLDLNHGRYDAAMDKLDRVLQCPEPWNRGHMEKIVRPQSELLRAEILERKAAEEEGADGEKLPAVSSTGRSPQRSP